MTVGTYFQTEGALVAGEQFKAEVDAIGSVLEHLEPLSGPARERVLNYVLRALDIAPPEHRKPGTSSDQGRDDRPPTTDPLVVPELGSGDRMPDIRSLADEKKPKSAVEMAALVGYYLTELAPEDERKESIVTADLERYFKIAPYPLPAQIKNLLGNAAGAGYFDRAGHGHYRLNPVGHNLVVHNLPSGDAAAQPRRRTARKALAKKTAPAKKTTPARKTTAKKTAS